MTTPVLLFVYAGTGVVLGFVVYRRVGRRDFAAAASIFATVLIWPLWAPFALGNPGAARSRRGPLATRIAVALDGDRQPEARLDLVMEPSAIQRLLGEVERAEGRLGELEARLGAARHALGSADRPRCDESRARAEIRAATIEQLEQLRVRERRALLDLAEICELLRTQSVLAEYGISDRAEELRDELWARVQAISELARTAQSADASRGA